jgi:phosphoglycolate phosphatase
MHATGRHMSILSSNARENILACLRSNRVEGLFESVVGYRRLFGKGRALRRLLSGPGSVPRSEAVYIGDEVRDIEGKE